jgi:transcriptional regulator PpsR
LQQAGLTVITIFQRPLDSELGPAPPVLDRVLRASADVVLRIDPKGVIEEVYQDAGVSEDHLGSWVGRPWIDTVLPDTRLKVTQILEEARKQGVLRSRQVNQGFPGGGDLPVGFTGVSLDGAGRVLILGRSLKALSELQRRLVEAQQALERDYWRLRQMETRYRLLFQRSVEALLVLDARSLRILDANRAAGQAFGTPPRKLTGKVFPDDLNLSAEEREDVRGHLQGVRDQGRAETVSIRLGTEQGWRLDASIIQEERDGILLVHLRDRGTPLPSGSSGTTSGLNASILLEHGPDPFIVTDGEARIIMANRAFRTLVQVHSEGELSGQSMGRWLGRPGADMTVLLTNLEKFGEVRLFPTTLQSALDMESEVELSATPIQDSDPPLIGITLRNVSRRIWSDGGQAGGKDLPRVLEEMTDQVGKVSLKQLVQDTVAVVEGHFIEAALKLTDGNRTAAAEILGVSRQSLYTKLRRYDVEGQDR